MQNSSRQTSAGFTLVELMLAMAFFASILFISSATFVQILGVYNKGLAVKQMNQAGRSLTDNLIRNANQGVASSAIIDLKPDDNGKVQCIRIGQTMYLLSYAHDENPDDASGDTYKALDAGGQRSNINFARVNDIDSDSGMTTSCPPGGDANPIDTRDISPMLSDSLRVYDAKIENVGNGIVKFNLKVGTFAGLNDPSNVRIVGGDMSCPVDSLGNFCAFSEYDTVLYLPNASN